VLLADGVPTDEQLAQQTDWVGAATIMWDASHA
jgi:hypothetical protein